MFTVVTYTKIPAKNATPNEDGNSEYYICSDGKYYKLEGDGKTYTEIEKDSWVIEKVSLTEVPRIGPTVNTEGNIAHFKTYKMAVCAKINGKLDTNKIESRAFEVTVK